MSADILSMEKGELDCYWKLQRAGKLGLPAATALSGYSLAKFIRRIAVSILLGRRAAMPWLFPLVYLSVTHSTTALLIIVGLLGRPEIATDIALVQGATLATFYALSANTRNLILRKSSPVAASDILLLRLLLLFPLMGVSLLLAFTASAVTWWLAACIVLRRGVEWINETHLCEAELSQRTRFAVSFLLLQGGLFCLAAVSLASGWQVAILAMALWAILPLVFSIRFASSISRATAQSIRHTFKSLTSHAGSTLIIGLRIYAFRILVVLLVAREVAGDLFTAIAIGSFMGTLFANVVGPSIELHRERAEMTYYPPVVRAAMWLGLLAGVSLLAALHFSPQAFPLLGKSAFFWLACGLSLIGGTVMVAAQGVRLRLLRAKEGHNVFGPDVIIHIAILGTVPMAYFVLGPAGLAGLYLADALLCYFFYKSSEIGLQQNEHAGKSMKSYIPPVLSFFLVFPIFFQLSGKIYNSTEPVLDSGGVLANLPLPASIIACFTGILLLARYRHATWSFSFILVFFAVMLLSSALTTNELLERGKLLLLIQCLLPAFGLVLGEMMGTGGKDPAAPEKGFMWACIAIIPVQLVASWVQGQLSLTHYLGLFSVYQHWQYVPVVVVAATLVASATLGKSGGYRTLSMALPLMGLLYAISAFSMLASTLAIVGTFGLVFLQNRSRVVIALISALIVSGMGWYMHLLRGEPEFSTKFLLPVTQEGRLSPPCLEEPARFVSNIVSPRDSECIAKGEPRHRFGYLIALTKKRTDTSSMLVVEGSILSGGIAVGLVQGGTWAHKQNIETTGPFRIELKPGPGIFEGVIANYLPGTSYNEIRIIRMAWENTPAGSAADHQTMNNIVPLPGWAQEYLPMNLQERFGDWMLFGRPVFSSPGSFFFGHQPMDRVVKTSAHNYYIDLAYNFGVIALLPVFVLLIHTARLLWQQRMRVMKSRQLLWLALLVSFLLLVDSNFKVTLRQPYPGIFAFFLWGLLLARLRESCNGSPGNHAR
ncbi:MAG: hypothetical protein KF771_03040 [Burkholderiales bacterium]|nr:hypothetical protein [Burkholderiales bacterium]